MKTKFKTVILDSDVNDIKIVTYFKWQNFFVDAKKNSHGLSPRTQTSNVTTRLLSRLHIVVFHFEIRLQQFDCLLVNCVL